MKNKHLKRCSTSFVTRKLQIKTRYQNTPLRMAKIQNIKCWEGYVATEPPIYPWWESKMGQPLWKNSWAVPSKLNIQTKHTLIINSSNHTPWHSPIQKLMPTQNLAHKSWLATLFINAKTWKQSRYPSVEKWIKKLIQQWNIILLKRNELSSIFLSKRSQSKKTIWRRKWQPTPVFLPGKIHGQRSLAGWSPWDYMTERVCTRVEGDGLVPRNW